MDNFAVLLQPVSLIKCNDQDTFLSATEKAACFYRTALFPKQSKQKQIDWAKLPKHPFQTRTFLR